MDEGRHRKYRAQLYQELGKHEALADLDKAIELTPQDHEVWRWRGKVKSDLERWEEALADFSKAVEIKPSQRLVYSERASVYQKLGQHVPALADYQKAIDLNPELIAKKANAHAGRGNILLEGLKQYDKAIEEYSKAIVFQPNEPEHYRKRAEAYQAMGDTEKAKADREEASRLSTNALNPDR